MNIPPNTQGLWNLLDSIINYTQDKFIPVDARLNISQLARKYGYPLQIHTVTTDDGYILNLHRIPNSQNKRKRPVVFLMHGILESSDTWVLMGPDKALAYVLSDQGFDVWIGNARGNKHANQHTFLDTSATEYWQFSWEEIALYDLPAMIDYILKMTGADSIYYVGHSQGTTVGYVLCSMKPNYNNKIKIMFSLAPEAWMGHVKSPIVRIFSPATKILGLILKDFNTYSAGVDFFNTVSAFLCSVMSTKCDSILYTLSGHETKINATFLSVILGHSPTGSSVLQFVHYGQLVQSHRFCRYDYGEEENLNNYGETAPPDYDLSRVTASVVLFYSPKDWVSDHEDVEILKQNLQNVNQSIFLEDFTHLDYVYAPDAVDVIYGTIVNKINDFEDHYHQIDVKVSTYHPKSKKHQRSINKYLYNNNNNSLY